MIDDWVYVVLGYGVLWVVLYVSMLVVGGLLWFVVYGDVGSLVKYVFDG